MDKNIVLIGMPGCGKTTIGKMLANRLEYDYVDMDKYIVSFGKSIEELFSVSQENFRDVETKASYDLAQYTSHVISTGGGIITRDINMQNLSKSGIIIFIDRDICNILSDIDYDSRPLLKDKEQALQTLYKKRYDKYKKYADITLKNNKSLEGIVSEIISILEKQKGWI